MRKTKIICTIGPASDTRETICSLIDNGMNVARMNFSHGNHESHKRVFELLDSVRKEKKLPIAILLDTRGPEIRIGTFKEGKVELKKHQMFALTTVVVVGDENMVSISYKHI